MGEHHNRGACGAASQVILEPIELVFAERSHAARLQVRHVVEADKVDTLVIEALPARSFGSFSEALNNAAWDRMPPRRGIAWGIDPGLSVCRISPRPCTFLRNIRSVKYCSTQA